jgi:Na+-driven multidrug efflux pump
MMGKFMIATFTDLILRVVLAVILSKTSFGASGIWLAWPLGWVTACYLSVRFYLSGEWNHEEVNAEEPLALSE